MENREDGCTTPPLLPPCTPSNLPRTCKLYFPSPPAQCTPPLLLFQPLACKALSLHLWPSSLSTEKGSCRGANGRGRIRWYTCPVYVYQWRMNVRRGAGLLWLEGMQCRPQGRKGSREQWKTEEGCRSSREVWRRCTEEVREGAREEEKSVKGRRLRAMEAWRMRAERCMTTV